MLVVLVGLALAMLWSHHPSPGGRTFRRWLVETPAILISRMTAGRLFFFLFVFGAVAGALLFLGGEGGRIAVSGLGSGIDWFVAFDVGTYLDALGVLWLLGAARGYQAVVRHAEAIVAKLVRRIAPRRSWRPQRRRRTTGPRPIERANDDDPAGRPAFIAMAA